MSDYLTVAEFADTVGVSRQSIYRKLSNTDNLLNNFVNIIDNRKMIDISAAREIYGVEIVNKDCQHKSISVNEVEQQSQQAASTVAADYIETLKEQLAEKDKQIADLTKALDQQQQLHLQLQSQLALQEPPQEEESPGDSIDETKPKKGFFRRFFS